MGFWNKLGKIALQAAPYVAAPFTGGASLMATGVTQKLGQKWAESDAKKAIAKGLAPSKFDKYLGMASAGAGLGSMAFGGALSGLGKAGNVGAGIGKGASLGSIASKAGTGASSVPGWAGNLGKIASAASGKGGSGWTGAVGQAASNAVPGGLGNGGWQGQLSNVLNQAAGMRNPSGDGLENNEITSQNLPAQVAPRMSGMAAAVNRGRNEALYNQPFRAGYETKIQGPEEGQVITAQMPRIYPNYGPPTSAPESNNIFNQAPPQTPIANAFGDSLTPVRRTARRRMPIEEEVY